MPDAARHFVVTATGIWLVILIAAMVNGLVREKVLTPVFGEQISLPLSGITLSLLILLVAWLLVPSAGKHSGRTFVLIGLLWVVLTLAFEYLFGHYFLGRSWAEVNEVFDLTDGNLLLLALCTAALAPWWVARVRGLLE
jgi:hypothetical protein